MDKTLHNLLRDGLKQKNRSEFLKELADMPQSADKNYVAAGLKDSRTKPDDEESIVSGDHYQNWRKNNVKTISEARDINDRRGFNETLDSDIVDGDSFEVDGCTFDVSIEQIIDIMKRGERIGSEGAVLSDNNKVMEALLIFDKYLSDADKKKFQSSFEQAFKDATSGRKTVSLKKYSDVLNDKLSDVERLRVFTLLQKKFSDVYA